MAGHTGQSSQLFPLAADRNAQFLATVAKGPNPLMPKNVTTELNVTVRKGTCFIREKHETRPSALLVSSEKIIARDAGLGADCA